MLSDCIGRLEDTKEQIESILEAETGVLENTPENLQGTDRYEIGENSCASAVVSVIWCLRIDLSNFDQKKLLGLCSRNPTHAAVVTGFAYIQNSTHEVNRMFIVPQRDVLIQAAQASLLPVFCEKAKGVLENLICLTEFRIFTH